MVTRGSLPTSDKQPIEYSRNAGVSSTAANYLKPNPGQIVNVGIRSRGYLGTKVPSYRFCCLFLFHVTPPAPRLDWPRIASLVGRTVSGISSRSGVPAYACLPKARFPSRLLHCCNLFFTTPSFICLASQGTTNLSLRHNTTTQNIQPRLSLTFHPSFVSGGVPQPIYFIVHQHHETIRISRVAVRGFVHSLQWRVRDPTLNRHQGMSRPSSIPSNNY